MLTIRTDLAKEAYDLWREGAEKTTKLPGVRAREEEWGGFPLNRVEILDKAGEKALGKKRGTYLTLDITAYWRREREVFHRVTEALGALLAPLLPESGPVLVFGLGNRHMTPDALGPLATEHLLVTRHLGKVLPQLRPVAAISAGVVGETGIEVAEWAAGAAERVKPAAAVVIDALAARGLDRLCSTIQISDTGLTPGSGVGNHRMALDRETLGVPVISIGVPTVVDGATVARDILAEAGQPQREPEALFHRGRQFFVTPDSIDAKVADLAKVVGWGLNYGLQPELTEEDLAALLE